MAKLFKYYFYVYVIFLFFLSFIVALKKMEFGQRRKVKKNKAVPMMKSRLSGMKIITQLHI